MSRVERESARTKLSSGDLRGRDHLRDTWGRRRCNVEVCVTGARYGGVAAFICLSIWPCSFLSSREPISILASNNELAFSPSQLSLDQKPECPTFSSNSSQLSWSILVACLDQSWEMSVMMKCLWLLLSDTSFRVTCFVVWSDGFFSVPIYSVEGFCINTCFSMPRRSLCVSRSFSPLCKLCIVEGIFVVILCVKKRQQRAGCLVIALFCYDPRCLKH
jgi:hypothetical protein